MKFIWYALGFILYVTIGLPMCLQTPYWKTKKVLNFLNLNQTGQVINEVLFANNSGITELKHVSAKDTGTVFALWMGTIVDTRFVFLPIEDVSYVYILHYGVSCHIQSHLEFIKHMENPLLTIVMLKSVRNST